MATRTTKRTNDQEQRRREVDREATNASAENNLRMAQCDPAEIARQAQENLATAKREGRSMPKAKISAAAHIPKSSNNDNGP